MIGRVCLLLGVRIDVHTVAEHLHSLHARKRIGELLNRVHNAIPKLAHNPDLVRHRFAAFRFGFKAVRDGSAVPCCGNGAAVTVPDAPSALTPISAWWANVARLSASNGRSGGEEPLATGSESSLKLPDCHYPPDVILIEAQLREIRRRRSRVHGAFQERLIDRRFRFAAPRLDPARVP